MKKPTLPSEYLSFTIHVITVMHELVEPSNSSGNGMKYFPRLYPFFRSKVEIPLPQRPYKVIVSKYLKG